VMNYRMYGFCKNLIFGSLININILWFINKSTFVHCFIIKVFLIFNLLKNYLLDYLMRYGNIILHLFFMESSSLFKKLTVSARTVEAVVVFSSSPSLNRTPSLAGASVVFHFRMNRNFRLMETWDF